MAFVQDDSTPIAQLPSHFNVFVEFSERKEDLIPLFLALLAVIMMWDPLILPTNSTPILRTNYKYKVIQMILGISVFISTKYLLQGSIG